MIDPIEEVLATLPKRDSLVGYVMEAVEFDAYARAHLRSIMKEEPE